ncbi:hypothetical protein BU23DRAFT_188779 [Bimuria novae-zelandiae CBS 107.79]|uniref:Uncharacterized protein n=1 Tax=Bimuria novae-zelandiae CBS 107.79 TaxID=1447943 RepID=A0A6A5VPF7_9PLEO|nr:hypothetical protein BU23DRAFT_188779 [Bimuria novae-zelandiae CBS 107.79]
MSFLRIIPEIYANAGRMVYASLKNFLAPKSLNESNSTATILLTRSLKEYEGPATILAKPFDSRSRPAWMSQGFTPSNTYEDHIEPFLSLSEAELQDEEAMHAYHAHTSLLALPHLVFTPNLAPLDPSIAYTLSASSQDGDIAIHFSEAHEALLRAVHLISPACRSHPAFTSPLHPNTPFSSPLVSVMETYIRVTHATLPHSIRVAPPWQIRDELETCLLLAFAPYVTSRPFLTAQGENVLVPELVGGMVKEGAKGSLVQIREALQICELFELEGSEEFLGVWEAWVQVVECFVGLLVLRHEGREGEVRWV